MHNSNSVLTYLKDGLFWYRVTLNTIEINKTFICKYCEKQPLIFICFQVCISKSKFREIGQRQKSAWRMYTKSPVLHSTLPRPILLSNSTCLLFYLNLVEIATFRLRTVWKRFRQIPLPFSVHEQNKPFCSDG